MNMKNNAHLKFDKLWLSTLNQRGCFNYQALFRNKILKTVLYILTIHIETKRGNVMNSFWTQALSLKPSLCLG